MKKIVARLLCSAALFTPAAAMAQSAASDFTSGTRYDKMHRVVGTIAPDPDGTGSLHYLAVRNTYDANGRLIRVEKGELATWQSEAVAPASWSGFSLQQKVETDYDSLDRKVKETVWGWNAAGGAWAAAPTIVTQYSYDAVGRLECTAVRMDPASFGSLPASACDQTSASNPIDRITKNIYDATGQLLQVRRAVGSSLEQAYVTYSYTPNGKQEYVVDANGNKALLTYDAYDRQTTWQFPALTAPTGFNGSTPATALATAGAVNTSDREEYEYDLNGNRTKLVKRDGRSILFGYDALNRVTSKTFPDGGSRGVYYAYNARGLQTAARFDSDSGADAVISAWDGFGRQTSSTTNMAGTSRQLNYDYDANGNLIRLTYPDSHYVDYVRDGLDRFYYSQFDGTSLLFHTPHDAAGRIQTLFRWNYATGAWTFGTSYSYDSISRLTTYAHSLAAAAGVTTTLGYNAASQLVSRTRDSDAYRFTGYATVDRDYTVNGLNQYTSAYTATFLYDANGNLTTDGTTGYTYDVENRLVSSTAGAALVYDPLGRLWQTSLGSGSGVTQFLYNGDALTAEYDGSGNMLKRYVHGTADGVDDPMVEYVGTSLSPRYLFADHQGSIIATADANGNRVGVGSYDEYGIPAAGNSGRFQYTGQAWIPELGMYHYKARIYSPTLGRFLQTDPIGYDDQINLYAYVANDPVNHADPSGEKSWLVSRATPYAGQSHMFVIVTDDKTGKVVAQFSYGPDGPTWKSFLGQNNLVSATKSNDATYRGDLAAWQSMKAGKAKGVSAVTINAKDSSVIAAGNAVDSFLGSAQSPGGVTYTFYGANSNAAAYAVADLAAVQDGADRGSQSTPTGSHPGVGAFRQVEAGAERTVRQGAASSGKNCSVPTGSIISSCK